MEASTPTPFDSHTADGAPDGAIPDCAIVIHNVTHSSGQGHETVFPEIVARALGIEPGAIVLRQGDPEGPALFGGGAFASRSMLTHGAASDVAAREVVRKGMALASEALEAAASDLEYAAGEYRIAGTDRAVGLIELARRNPGALDTTSELPAARAERREIAAAIRQCRS